MNAALIAKAAYNAQITLEWCYPAQVEYDGTTYTCASRGLQSEGKLAFGGFVYQCNVAFRIRKELMPTPPTEGSRIKWNDQEFRVHAVPDRPTDVAWYVACETTEK